MRGLGSQSRCRGHVRHRGLAELDRLQQNGSSVGRAGGQEAPAAARTAGGKARVRVAVTPASEPGAPRLGWVKVHVSSPPPEAGAGVRAPLPGAELEAERRPPPAGSPGRVRLGGAHPACGPLTFLLLMSERPGLTLLRRVSDARL